MLIGDDYEDHLSHIGWKCDFKRRFEKSLVRILRQIRVIRYTVAILPMIVSNKQSK